MAIGRSKVSKQVSKPKQSLTKKLKKLASKGKRRKP